MGDRPEQTEQAACDVLVCAREADGGAVARWIASRLDGRDIPLASERGEPPRARVAVLRESDDERIWKDEHLPRLDASRCMILICSPGVAAPLSETDSVHRAVTWWVENRADAPFLLYTTSGDERFIPAAVRRRWPKAQRTHVDATLLGESADAHRRGERLVELVAESIAYLHAKAGNPQLAQRERELRRARRLLVLSSVLVAVVVAALGAWVALEARAAERKKQILNSIVEQVGASLGKQAAEIPTTAIVAHDIGVAGVMDVLFYNWMLSTDEFADSWWLARAEAKLATDDPEGALEDASCAVELLRTESGDKDEQRPRSLASALLLRARTRVRVGRLGEARDDLEECLRLRPGHVEASVRLAQTLASLGESERAEALMAAVADRAPLAPVSRR
ncbi:MAG: tetratricopeptide repeat protein [Planctomycetota bacterium]